MAFIEPYRPDAHGVPLEGFAIRTARPEDAAPIARIDAERHGWVVREIEPKIFGELTRIERGELSKKTWVACFEDAIVAYAKCSHRRHVGPAELTDLPDGWYLGGIGIQPKMRRRGLGRALTACRIEWLQGMGADIWYFTAAANRASIRLHEAFGFEEERRGIELPNVSFVGGIGVLFGLRRGPHRRAASRSGE